MKGGKGDSEAPARRPLALHAELRIARQPSGWVFTLNQKPFSLAWLEDHESFFA